MIGTEFTQLLSNSVLYESSSEIVSVGPDHFY